MVVNPSKPAPLSTCIATTKRIAGCLVGALSSALPAKVPAYVGDCIFVETASGGGFGDPTQRDAAAAAVDEFNSPS
jgi:N-methylhydantoinase B/oxoprolinase/acetone carboxylase alpha subunit